MKHSTIAAGLLLCALGFSPAVLASSAPEPASATLPAVDTLRGSIQRVSDDGSSFVLEVEGRQVTVVVDDATEFTLDGDSASREEALVVGRRAAVTRDGERATRVAVQSMEG